MAAAAVVRLVFWRLGRGRPVVCLEVSLVSMGALLWHLNGIMTLSGGTGS